MKRFFLMFAYSFLLLNLACQPTPEVEIIPNKGEQKDWQTEAVPYVPEKQPAEQPEAAATVEASVGTERRHSPLFELVGACPTWNMEDRTYGFLITAQDCPVVLPDISAVPVVEAKRRSFTQAEIDAVAAAMFPADTVWYPEVVWTKEEVAAMMQETMEEAAKGDPNENETGRNAKYFEDKLTMYKKAYDEALFADEIVPTSLEINPCQEDFFTENGQKYPGVKVEARVNGEKWTMTARTAADDPLLTYIEAERGCSIFDEEQPLEAPYGVQMPREEAIQKATEFVQKITGGNEYSVCYCVPVIACPDEEGETCAMPARWSQWSLVLMRAFNGCPSAYAKEEVGGDMDSAVAKPVQYERITLQMDDEGVSYFRWNTPMEVTGVVNSNARLISFDEAARRALSGVNARWKYSVEGRRKNGLDTSIYFSRVTFGLWRIAKKNGGWYYVPVYHFFTEGTAGEWADWPFDNPFFVEHTGISGATYRDVFLQCLEKRSYRFITSACLYYGASYSGSVTVNALDGTIIDKDKGY